ncbi:hypothetical protein C8Q76DRAFT_624467 [Earliella scabrosa]|nr:hypothetical protein C8Q76DRAFT_624467 [Earliella scabrosa]
MAAFDRANRAYQFPKEKNRRGDDVEAINCGISFGGGQTFVRNLGHEGGANDEVVGKLMRVAAVKRLAEYGSAMFQKFQPTLSAYYEDTLTRLCAKYPALRRLWDNSVFACATMNVGSHTVTCRHFDQLNLAYGGCAITAIGRFDPKKGGHAVLWEWKMVIEFPPVSTIIIPSAVVSHSNIDIGKNERRYSFTQYSPAGLFRWVACGYKSKKAMEASGGRLNENGSEHWERGMGMLSTWEALKALWS